MGSRQTVTIVMTVSVASDEDAWLIVSEYAGLIEDFWTAGAIDAKTHATVPAIATEEAAKDKPSRRSDACDRAVEAMIARAATTSGIHARTFVV